jgi:hypothetical protein
MEQVVLLPGSQYTAGQSADMPYMKCWVQLSNLVEQSPSLEANSRSACLEKDPLFRTLKIHYCVQNGPPLVPMLSHLNSVHTLPSITLTRFNPLKTEFLLHYI